MNTTWENFPRRVAIRGWAYVETFVEEGAPVRTWLQRLALSIAHGRDGEGELKIMKELLSTVGAAHGVEVQSAEDACSRLSRQS